jgi:hypothetical protein
MMKRQLTKRELLAQIESERGKLEETVATLSKTEMLLPGVTDEGWSVKDVLAHVADRQQQLLVWYTDGLRGVVSKKPASGTDGNDKLDAQFLEKYRRRSMEDVQAEFRMSYRKLLQTVQTISDTDLMVTGRYAWTGNATLGDFVASNTFSRYRWARTLIRKWAKSENVTVTKR